MAFAPSLTIAAGSSAIFTSGPYTAGSLIESVRIIAGTGSAFPSRIQAKVFSSQESSADFNGGQDITRLIDIGGVTAGNVEIPLYFRTTKTYYWLGIRIYNDTAGNITVTAIAGVRPAYTQPEQISQRF